MVSNVAESCNNAKMAHRQKILRILNEGDLNEIQKLPQIGAKTASSLHMHRWFMSIWNFNVSTRSRRTKTVNTNLVYHRSMPKSLSKGRNCNKICMVKNTVCSRQGTRTYNRMYECEPHQVHLMVNCEDCNKSTLRAILHSSMTLYSAHVYQ